MAETGNRIFMVLPPAFLLRCAASMKTKISRVSSFETGGWPTSRWHRPRTCDVIRIGRVVENPREVDHVRNVGTDDSDTEVRRRNGNGQ